MASLYLNLALHIHVAELSDISLDPLYGHVVVTPVVSITATYGQFI